MISKGFEFLGIKSIDLSNDTQVNSGGGTNTQNLQPNEGECYQLIAIDYKAPDPAGSSSGSHKLVGVYDLTYDCYLFSIEGNSGTSIYIAYGAFVGDTETPSTPTEQFNIINGAIFASYDNPFKFVYTNDTDVNQTATRELTAIVKVFKQVV